VLALAEDAPELEHDRVPVLVDVDRKVCERRKPLKLTALSDERPVDNFEVRDTCKEGEREIRGSCEVEETVCVERELARAEGGCDERERRRRAPARDPVGEVDDALTCGEDAFGMVGPDITGDAEGLYVVREEVRWTRIDGEEEAAAEAGVGEGDHFV